MRLLLVRHGESVCGVEGVVGGARGCTGLTERGFAQARALRDRLEAEGWEADVLFASTLPRAYQTAETLAPALGAEVVRDPDLCEFVPGEIDGTRWEDWASFDVRLEPDRPISPGGESLTAFTSRVRDVIDRLAADHDGKTVVAVCHGGVVFASRRLLLGLDDPAEVEFTSITELHRSGEEWTLVRFNDHAHIQGTELLPARA